MQGFHAVVTGDLVRSSTLDDDQLERVRERLRRATEELAGAGLSAGEPFVGSIEFFRGDAWQLLLSEPRLALRTTLYLRCALLVQGLGDTRASIGIGRVDRVTESRISLSTGEAFELSGRALDGMGPRFRLSLALSPDLSPDDPWPPVVAHLCDSVVSQWEGRQIETALIALRHPDATHRRIGGMLAPPVTQQAVSKSLQSAGWHGLSEALDAFEQLMPPSQSAGA
ncbi:MAG TPA: hypothetical protein VKA32_01845 [Gammaproteobacteria bacterium]|nr:hypothetical protein [Gammaproteobacteria bacterium]